MHPGAKTSHSSCTVYGCRAAASSAAKRRRAATPRQSREPSRARQPARPRPRIRRAWSCARRTTSCGSPTPVARPPRRSGSAGRRCAGCCPTWRRSSCLGGQADPRRRARPARRGAAPCRCRSPPADAPAGSETERAAGGRRTDPVRPCHGKEPWSDRGRTQRRRNANRARGCAMVALHRAGGS